MKIPGQLIPPKTPLQTLPTPEIRMVQWFDDRYYLADYIENGKPQSKFIASVTTKLGITDKPYLGRWRGDIGNREADLRIFEAQERGKRIHSAWYTLCEGGLVIYNPWERETYTPAEIEALKEKHLGNIWVLKFQDEMLQLIKLGKWIAAIKPKFLYNEKTVYSLSANDAGTVDNIVQIAGGSYTVNGSKPLVIPAGTYILDLKTGKMIDDNAYLQTACYAYCAEELKLANIMGTIILHTSAQTKSGIEGLATALTLRPEMDEHYNEYRLVADLWTRRNRNASPKVFEFPATLSLETIAHLTGEINETAPKRI